MHPQRGGGRNQHRQNPKTRQGRYVALADDDGAGDAFYEDSFGSPQSSGCWPRGGGGRGRSRGRGGGFRGGGGRGAHDDARAGATVFNRLAGNVVQTARRGVQNLLDRRHDRQLQRETAGRMGGGAPIYKITIPRGGQFGRVFILRSIGQYVDDLKPILFRTNDNGDCHFFVRDENVSQAIRSISRRIRDPKSNTPLIFNVSKEPPQWADVSGLEMQLIKQVLAKRYNPETQALDLSSFGIDPIFTSNDMNLSLSRNNIAITVVELIDEMFTNVTAISLKGNRIRFLAFIGNLVCRTKNVHTLDLQHNQIDRATELDFLRDWPLHTLYLENNPIVSQYSDPESYLSFVHKLWPKVTSLDGITVQRTAFGLPELDDEDNKTLPPIKPGYYGNDQIRSLVETFLIEFFGQYDGPSPKQTRKMLMQAYDDDATFTMAMSNLPDGDSRPRHDNPTIAGDYLKSSHNIMALEKWERYREKIVVRGAMEVAVFLSNLPPSRHEMETFVVDVSLVTGNLMNFTVQGLFRDGANIEKPDGPRLFFSRTFMVVSRGANKIAVVNDILYISALTEGQTARYRVQLERANKYQEPPIQPTATLSLGGIDQPSSSTGINSVEELRQKQQLIEQFAQESGMKPEWAQKCLEDQNWDYQNAGRVFLELRGQNAIPPNAFS